MSLVETVALWGAAPEEDVVVFLRELANRLDEEVMAYRNRQNRNSFEAEEEGVCQ